LFSLAKHIELYLSLAKNYSYGKLFTSCVLFHLALEQHSVKQGQKKIRKQVKKNILQDLE